MNVCIYYRQRFFIFICSRTTLTRAQGLKKEQVFQLIVKNVTTGRLRMEITPRKNDYNQALKRLCRNFTYMIEHKMDFKWYWRREPWAVASFVRRKRRKMLKIRNFKTILLTLSVNDQWIVKTSPLGASGNAWVQILIKIQKRGIKSDH